MSQSGRILSVCSQASSISPAWQLVRNAEPQAPLSPAEAETEDGAQQPAGAGPLGDSDAPQSLRATVLDYWHFNQRGSTLSSERARPCSLVHAGMRRADFSALEIEALAISDFVFLCLLKVGISAAQYFLFKMIVLLILNYFTFLISNVLTWIFFGNVIGHLNHYLNSCGGEEGVHSSHLALWPFLVWSRCCHPAMTTTAAVPTASVCQPQSHCPLPELPLLLRSRYKSARGARGSSVPPRPFIHVRKPRVQV